MTQVISSTKQLSSTAFPMRCDPVICPYVYKTFSLLSSETGFHWNLTGMFPLSSSYLNKNFPICLAAVTLFEVVLVITSQELLE